MQSILVVEDNPDHRELLIDGLREYCGESQVELIAVASAKEAMKLIRERAVSIIITDMYLEEPDAGFRLIRSAKRLRPRSLIIVTTAYASLDRVPSWMRSGAFEVIAKPFSLDTLWPVLHRALALTSTDIDRDALVERLIMEEWESVNRSTAPEESGTSLENFCALLFSTIPGWSQVEIRLTAPSEEFDLVITNESNDMFWREYGAIIMVECKNWHRKRRPGRNEFDAFFMKIRRRAPSDCRLGFYVSLSGFAKTFLDQTRQTLHQPQFVVPLDSESLWSLVVASDRSAVLKKHVRAAIMGLLFKG